MQTNDKENYSKTQRRVLAVIVATILFCGVFALISNISVLKTSKLKILLIKTALKFLKIHRLTNLIYAHIKRTITCG